MYVEKTMDLGCQPGKKTAMEWNINECDFCTAAF